MPAVLRFQSLAEGTRGFGVLVRQHITVEMYTETNCPPCWPGSKKQENDSNPTKRSEKQQQQKQQQQQQRGRCQGPTVPPGAYL